MRKISEDAARAFLYKKKFKQGNTKVEVKNSNTYMYLFGNAIAWIDAFGTMSINLQGWGTPTTKDRLNALPYVDLCTKNGEILFHGKPISIIAWLPVCKLDENGRVKEKLYDEYIGNC